MKILLYTNIITPYRKYFYDLLFKECRIKKDEFVVYVMAKTESNRGWNYEQFSAPYIHLLKGFTISIGERYLHINAGIQHMLVSEAPNVVITAGSYICPGVWIIANSKKTYKYKVLLWNESHKMEKRKLNSFVLSIREFIRRQLFGKFDAFLCPGILSRELIKDYVSKDVRFIDLPNLVDDAFYGKDVHPNLYSYIDKTNCDHKLFFIPARLSPVKGIENFLELLSQCKNANKVDVIIAGDGSLHKSINDMAQRLQLSVILLGTKSKEEIRDLYNLVDCFVMPSLSDANPLTCIEALWAGLPLLVSNHVGNYPEVIEQGKNGYVFSYERKQEAINIIDEMVTNNDDWQRNAKLISKSIAKQKFSSKVVVCSLVDELNEFSCN